MSPEQLQSPSSVDPRSDVWSLGAILYEMLAGTAAFAGDSHPVVFREILDGRYAKLSERRPEVPLALEQVLGEALALERDDRPPTVEAFAARVVGFGTEAGWASYKRIQRIAACPPPAPEPPLAQRQEGPRSESEGAPRGAPTEVGLPALAPAIAVAASA